jgi:hypothetical protein
MSIRTSVLTLAILGSVAVTSFAGENMIGQGADRRDASQGLLGASTMAMDASGQAAASTAPAMGASNTQAMGASSSTQAMGASSSTQAMGAGRADGAMSGDRMSRQSAGTAMDLGLHRGGN